MSLISCAWSRFTFQLVDAEADSLQAGGSGEPLVAADFRFCIELTFRLSAPNTPVQVVAFSGANKHVGATGPENHLQVASASSDVCRGFCVRLTACTREQLILKSDRRACIRVWSWSGLRGALGVGDGEPIAIGVGRITHPVKVDILPPVPVDCVVGLWSDWSICSYVAAFGKHIALRFHHRLRCATARCAEMDCSAGTAASRWGPSTVE